MGNICYKCKRQEFRVTFDIINQEEYELDKTIEPIMKRNVLYDGNYHFMMLPPNEAFNCRIPEFKQEIVSKHNFIVGSFPQKGVVCYFHDGKIITLIS